MRKASAAQWGKLLSWSEVIRVYVVAASSVGSWRQAFRAALPAPALLWCVGPEASPTSRRLTAFLTERGLPVRWLALRYRPVWVEEALQSPWEKTTLAAFLRETPYLLLDAPEDLLHRLYRTLHKQACIEEVRFIPSCLRSPFLQEAVRAENPVQLQEWASLYEELAPDLALVEGWLPCLLTASAI